MKTLKALLGFLVALQTLTGRYTKHEIDKEEYISKFDKIVKSYKTMT